MTNGAAKISIHTYNQNRDAAKDDAIRLFIQTQEELKSKGEGARSIMITREKDWNEGKQHDKIYDESCT